MGTFGAGRMGSIRGVLMGWLLPTFLVVALVSAGLSYRMVTHMAGDLLDDQMVQLGDAVAQQGDFAMLSEQTAERVHGHGICVIQVFNADGQLAVASWAGVVAQPMPQAGLHDLEDGAQRWRVYAVAAPGGRTVQVLQSGSFRDSLAFGRAGAAVLPVLVLLPLSMLVLWGVARAISRTLREIGHQAARQEVHNIAALPLDRVPAEIRPLVGSFNHLLARLSDSFAAQRRFVQDAAHELRTPIAAVGLQLENLRGDLADGAAAQRFRQLESGVARAKRLVDQLLSMSRQESIAPEPGGSVQVQLQLRESIHALIALADQRRIDLGLVAAPGTSTLTLPCTAADLRSALDNLIENALRYTPEGGVVDVRLLLAQGRTVVEVVDTGPGIAEEWRARVFERFFRVPGSAPGGSGLGLAIAQAAAQRCGMALTLRNRDDRSGLIARLEATGPPCPAMPQA
ncbi:ATP-binding protein [Pseudorhodoferax sp.]|uniref:ATP-binding protein n=1 Tax=Pseudorhodoferax sp. TaxID=1993553 RepID=UPI002DD67E2D|nr:ATP-binding protein [Pseudorhodoferax sp.]